MKGKFLIFSITALLSLTGLTNCSSTTGGGSTDTTCPECPPCEDKGDGKDDGEGGGAEKPDTKVDPSQGLISPEKSEWGEKITNLMVEYLGGGILPLIELGDGEFDAEFVKNDEKEDYKSYLKIVGGSFLSSKLESAVKLYKEHYWNALMIGESFYASNDLIKVEVEVSKNYNGLFELKAFYQEPFNPKDATAWNEQTEALIKERFGRFVVPFTYLGTVNYDSSINEEGALVVSGGTWSDSVINQFETSFKGWEITKDEEVLTTRYATFKDGENELSATLAKAHNKAELQVSIKEAFDSSNQSAWSSEVLKEMDKSLNKTILPYVYLGAIYPTIDKATTNERNLTLVGKFWNDKILEKAKEAFKKDSSWSEKTVESGVAFTKSNEFDSYEVVVSKNESGLPVLKASRTEVYNETTLKAYPEDLKTAFKDKYAEEMDTIPFLYLGTAYPTLNTEIPAKHEEDTSKLVITGGVYNSKILDNFRTKFTKEAGWYTAIDNTHEDAGTKNDEPSDVLAVALKNTGEFTYKVGLVTLENAGEKTAYLEINRSKNTTTTATKWSDETLANMSKVLGSDVTLPFFDVGRDTLEIAFDDDGHLKIQFVADHTNVSFRVWSAIDSLTKADWELTIAHNDTYYDSEAWINQVTATKDFNGKKVQVQININASAYYRFVMKGVVSPVETYDASKVNGSWSEDISSVIKDKYKIDFPYVYLGTDNPYIFEDTEEGTTNIIGNALTNELFTNAKDVLTKNGFLIDTSASWDMLVKATKENSDGNIVNVEVSYHDNKPYISFSLTEVFKPGTQTAWDSKTQESLNKELPSGVTLPYLYLGTAEPTSTFDTKNNVKKISIVGGKWDDAVINLSKSSLETNSFSVSIDSSSSWTGPSLFAHKLLESSSAKAMRLKLSENRDDKIELDVYIDLVPDAPSDKIATWDEFPKYYGTSVTDAMQTYLGTKLPEFIPSALLPSTDDSINISSPYSQLRNKYFSMYSSYCAYDTYYLYVAMDKLKAEGFTVKYNPFSKDELAGFSASKNDANGTLYISFAPSSGNYSDSNNGMSLSALYLPDASLYDSTTAFSESEKNTISSRLDGLELPYANLGSDKLKITERTNEVSLIGYNYSEKIIENIKKSYGDAGWTVNDTYSISNGVAYKSVNGFLIKNGHTYVLTVVPTVSKAVNGGGAFSSSSVTTEVKVTMA